MLELAVSTAESDFGYHKTGQHRVSAHTETDTTQLPPIRPPTFPPPPAPATTLINSNYQTITRGQLQEEPPPSIPQSMMETVRLHSSDREPFLPPIESSNNLQQQSYFYPDYARPTIKLRDDVAYATTLPPSTIGGNSIIHVQRSDMPPVQPAEAAVAKPLAVIAFFFCCQVWFSVPALILACRRNKSRSTYRASIWLSVIVIVFGVCIATIAIATTLLCTFHKEKLDQFIDIFKNKSQFS